ncbi:MAG TPA: hypothetical protein VLA43_02065 [Longimicrobiales bacterium]|nr:hypothetical protein [Longimicrobiales bacterium]
MTHRVKRAERGERVEKRGEARCAPLPGIIIHGREAGPPATPRIQAFIWGGKVPPTPTLPYGRWKGAA